MPWDVWCRESGTGDPLELPAELLVDMHRAWRTGVDPLLYLASLASELLESLEDGESRLRSLVL